MRGPVKQAHIRRATLNDPTRNSTRYRDESEPVSAPRLDELPPAPDYLPKVAKAEWEGFGNMLIQSGLLSSLDLSTLESFCILSADYRETCISHTKEKDEQRRRALIKTKLRLATAMQRAREQLGMTVLSRARLAGRVLPTEAKDDLDKFLDDA